MKDSKNIFKKIGLIGAGLCAACCMIPISAVTFGVGALTMITAYVEWVGLIVIMTAVVFFGNYYFRRKNAQACNIDCACKGGKNMSKRECKKPEAG